MEAYFAVIFSSRTSGDQEGYSESSKRMEELVLNQEGYLGMESARGEDGRGITVSYWKDEESISRWKNNFEHREIQRLGREKWYSEYSLRVCKVVREYHWKL